MAAVNCERENASLFIMFTIGEWQLRWISIMTLLSILIFYFLHSLCTLMIYITQGSWLTPFKFSTRLDDHCCISLYVCSLLIHYEGETNLEKTKMSDTGNDSVKKPYIAAADPQLHILSEAVRASCAEMGEGLKGALVSVMGEKLDGFSSVAADLRLLATALTGMAATAGTPNKTPLIREGDAGCSKASHPGTSSSNEDPVLIAPLANATATPLTVSDGDEAGDADDTISLLGEEDNIDNILDRAISGRNPHPPQGDLTFDPNGEVRDPQFKNILMEMDETNKNVGSPIFQEVATILNKLWTIPLKKDTETSRLQDAVTPQNLKIQPKKVNPDIFNMPGSDVTQYRSKDIELQKVQTRISKAVMPFAHVIEKLFLAKNGLCADVDYCEMLKLSLDSVILLANSFQMIDQMRRDSWTPLLQFPGLATSVQPGSELLFGDDLDGRIKELESKSKIRASLKRKKPAYNSNASSTADDRPSKKSGQSSTYSSSTYTKRNGSKNLKGQPKKNQPTGRPSFKKWGTKNDLRK